MSDENEARHIGRMIYESGQLRMALSRIAELEDAIERSSENDAVAIALRAENARLREALESIADGHPCDEEHREMARAALAGAAKEEG